MLLGGALITLAALLLASASETPESVGAQVCGGEVVALVAGCNPVAITFQDDTPIQTIAGCVAPPEILIAIWEFEAPTGVWLGYSPQFPEVSDLTEKDRLDVAFLCVDASGTFTRPVI
jgi:hypothetical protein